MYISPASPPETMVLLNLSYAWTTILMGWSAPMLKKMVLTS